MNLACRLFPEATIVIDSAILNYRYAYDTKGLMSSRSESVIDRLETYKYDNLDRLTQVKSGKIGMTGTAKAFSYENNGNIEQYGTGFYSYQSNDKPHAVRQITPSSNVSPQTVTYNFYNQPKKITEGNFKLELLYDADRQRSKGMKLENNKLQESVFYISKYFEKEMDADSLRNNHYIYDDNSVVALHITTAAIPELTLNDSIWLTHLSTTGGVVPKSGITNRMYNIHTDHLGSYCVLTDAGKNVVQNNRFDPWGNNVGQADFALTYRGFTGHEHYPEFKIINMNSRLYDPVIGRFFSPDNYVQIPEFTQSFNRYSYCLNNPLKYVDPSGNLYWKPDQQGHLIAEDGDDVHSLAKFLNAPVEYASQILKNQGYINEQGASNLVTGNKVVLENPFVRNIAAHGNLLSGDAELNYNCWGAAITGVKEMSKYEGYDLNNAQGIIEPWNFDRTLQKEFKSISPDNAIFGKTVLRFATSNPYSEKHNWNAILGGISKDPDVLGGASHGAVFYGRSNDGTVYVYTKNGWERPPQIIKLSDMPSDYGPVRGLNGQSGQRRKDFFYFRNQISLSKINVQ